MARRKQEASQAGNGGPSTSSNPQRGRRDIRWLNPYLDSDDKQWLKDNSPDIVEHVGQFLDNLPKTYSLSSRFDDKAARYLAVLVCSDPLDPNDGCALSMRATTRLDAIYAIAYLHERKYADGDWGSGGVEDGDTWG